ncbi:MAG TPA: ECF transporter S component [Firmicutes bacterium]|nr:ECF transporter S component [Bacillota bacterium]
MLTVPDLQTGDLKKTYWSPKRVARMAIFVALSAAGALIKIPSPTGTVALDSCPGYFSGISFGWLEGAIVAAIGHLFTAATTGFPLSVPMHLIIAVQMGVFAAAFWWVNKRVNLVAAVIVATLLNGVVCAFTVLPIGGMGMVISMLLPLIVGSAVNIIIAAVAYKIVKDSDMI